MLRSGSDEAQLLLAMALQARASAKAAARYLGSGHTYNRHARACSAVWRARWALTWAVTWAWLFGQRKGISDGQQQQH